MKCKSELKPKAEKDLKALEDDEDLRFLRKEKLSAVKEPARSLDEIIKNMECKNVAGV